MELPNLVTIFAEKFHGTVFAKTLICYERVIFSLIIIVILSLFAFFSTRRLKDTPGRLQGLAEVIVGSIDDFVCGVIGKRGRELTPFIGTLFLYILLMNFLGLVPFMKSSTSSWSTTLALAICVFAYLQYTAVRELGFFGYIYHLMERPKGIIAFSLVLPIMFLFLHIVSELIRPISLSLRLRSNIWGDDLLLTMLYGFGLPALPLLIFNAFLVILAAIVQAVVFALLTTIYFTLVLSHEE